MDGPVLDREEKAYPLVWDVVEGALENNELGVSR